MYEEKATSRRRVDNIERSPDDLGGASSSLIFQRLFRRVGSGTRTATVGRGDMPIQIESFLSAYEPKSICLKCLAAVTERGEDDVRATVMGLLTERRVETHIAECLNCSVRRLAVGWRSRAVAATGAGGGIGERQGLRDTIVAKLEAGALPDRLPEKIRGVFGAGHACDGCDEPILAAQVEYVYELLGGRILRLHIGCVGMWQAELRRRGAGRGE